MQLGEGPASVLLVWRSEGERCACAFVSGWGQLVLLVCCDIAQRQRQQVMTGQNDFADVRGLCLPVRACLDCAD